MTRMELASHGDALNTTSRIQGLCKEIGEDCVVSGPLMRDLTLGPGYRSRSLGASSLRGKDETIEVFAVTRA